MDLSHIQFVSAFACLALAFTLILSPYYDRRFTAYNMARKLLIGSQLILFAQFALQLIFHFRQNDPDLGAAVNHFFYIPASVLVYWSMLLCVGGKKVDFCDIVAGIAFWLLDSILLVIGLLYMGGADLHVFTAISFVLSLVLIGYFSVKVHLTTKRVKNEIDSYYANPVSAYINWMNRSTMALVIVSLFAFFATFDSRFIFVSGGLYWFAMMYYVISFDHFGYHLQSITEAIQESEAEPPAEVAAEEPMEHATSGDDAPVVHEEQPILSEDRLRRLETWVEEKGYCTNGVSIIELARIIGTNRTTLSQYINVAKHKSFRDWINQLRCDEAKRMMKRDPSLPIDDVADRCGFSSRKYFDQVFSANTGKTPAVYRDSFKL